MKSNVVKCAGAALVFWTAASYAEAYCYKPSAPTCPIMGKFESELDFDLCKSEMDRYRPDAEEYLACVNQEISSEHTAAVKKFNCHARGETFCY